MVRRVVGLVVLIVLVGAVAGVARPGAGVRARRVDARSGLVRTVVITRAARVRAPAEPLGAALHRQLLLLTRGLRLPGAGPRRALHARSITVPRALATPSVCAVAGRGCSLHPCVLFAGAGAVVLRGLATPVRVAPRGRPGARRTVAPVVPANGAGCRHLRPGALPVS